MGQRRSRPELRRHPNSGSRPWSPGRGCCVTKSCPTHTTAELIERGASSGEVQLHFGSRVVAVGLPSARMDDSAYSHLLTIPQWEVERVIEEHLRRQSVLVERGTELISYAEERYDGHYGLISPVG